MGDKFLLALLAGFMAVGCGGPQVEEAEVTAKETETAFIPSDFEPPARVEGDGFVLVPLGPDVMELDYAAYMSSIEHLQENFSSSDQWPREDLTLDDAAEDMANEQRRFEERESFAYAVLTPEEDREIGSFYIRPSNKEGYDAAIRLWVTKQDYDAGIEDRLYEWGKTWVEEEWPFEDPAFIGREISLEEWRTLPQAE